VPTILHFQQLALSFPVAIMASEKRAGSDSYSSGQMVVKRQNVSNNGKALATVNGSGANGALVQAVSLHIYLHGKQQTNHGD
jgi:hypothetical protein